MSSTTTKPETYNRATAGPVDAPGVDYFAATRVMVGVLGVVLGFLPATATVEARNPSPSTVERTPSKRFAVSLTWYVDETACPGPGSGTPGDPFCRVQDAINTAVDGDTVVILPGRYYENIHLNGRNITLRSIDPTDPAVVAATILDGSQPIDPQNGSVITFVGTEGPSCVIDGLTITGGTL